MALPPTFFIGTTPGCSASISWHATAPDAVCDRGEHSVRPRTQLAPHAFGCCQVAGGTPHLFDLLEPQIQRAIDPSQQLAPAQEVCRVHGWDPRAAAEAGVGQRSRSLAIVVCVIARIATTMQLIDGCAVALGFGQ